MKFARRHTLLYESPLTSAAFGRNQREGKKIKRQKNRRPRERRAHSRSSIFLPQIFLPICSRFRKRSMPTDAPSIRQGAIPRIKSQAGPFSNFSRYPWYCHAIRGRFLFGKAGRQRNDSRRIHRTREGLRFGAD